jgi:O-methyltransferase
MHVPPMDMPTFSAELAHEIENGWDYVRHATLALAAKRIDIDGVAGSLAEVGVWRGDCAKFIHLASPGRCLYLFDTFEGFPNSKEDDEDIRFRDTSVNLVLSRFATAANVIIKKGIFPFTAFDVSNQIFSLVSLDTDTYESIAAGWEFFYPRVSPGGYIFIHDYNAMEYERGPYRATNDFLQDKLEKLIELPDQWGSALIRKS